MCVVADASRHEICSSYRPVLIRTCVCTTIEHLFTCSGEFKARDRWVDRFLPLDISVLLILNHILAFPTLIMWAKNNLVKNKTIINTLFCSRTKFASAFWRTSGSAPALVRENVPETTYRSEKSRSCNTTPCPKFYRCVLVISVSQRWIRIFLKGKAAKKTSEIVFFTNHRGDVARTPVAPLASKPIVGGGTCRMVDKQLNSNALKRVIK